MAAAAGLRVQASARPRHQELRDQPGPPRLVRRPGAAAVVAVEEFVERNVVAVIGIRLQLRVLAQDRAVACGVFQEQPREAVRQFVGDLFEG